MAESYAPGAPGNMKSILVGHVLTKWPAATVNDKTTVAVVAEMLELLSDGLCAAIGELDQRIHSLEKLTAPENTASIKPATKLAKSSLRSVETVRTVAKHDENGRIAEIREVSRELPTQDELAAMERRLKRIESRPTTTYRGVWSGMEIYVAGDMATHSGGLWVCKGPTKSKPGDDATWQLAVKRGRAEEKA
jgi:hypothetical protein